MNQGKRYIRNTVLALAGGTVLVAAAHRLYASTVDAHTPRWLRSIVSLGLTVAKPEAEPQEKKLQAVNLVDVRDFSALDVENIVAVDIIGAQHYRVSLTPTPGKSGNIGAEWIDGGLLRIKGGPDAAGAVLHVEAPTLASINVKGVDLLTVRALQATEVSLRMKGLKAAQILESKVDQWKMDAATPVEVRMGDGTSTGVTLKISGKTTISYLPKAKQTPSP